MSRRDVIRRIVQRDGHGLELTEAAVARDDKSLHELACEHFGTWQTALHYAGINPRQSRARGDYSTPENMIKKIRWYCRNGYNLMATRIRRHDFALYDAARRHFGNWRRAVAAAGIDVNRAGLHMPRSRPVDRQKLIEALRAWHEAGHSMRWYDVSLENRELAITAKNTYGGWRKALVATGLDDEVGK